MFLGLNIVQWKSLGISTLIFLAVVLTGRWFIRLFIDRGIRRLTRHTQTLLDDTVLESIRPPLYWLLVVISLDIGLRRLDFLADKLEITFGDIFFVLYFLVVFIFAYRLTSRLFGWYGHEVAIKTETDMDTRLIPFFRRIALVILSAIGLIILLGHFNIKVDALITTLGIGSLALALAAQAALEDTISGFLIMMDQPYRIGDRIEIQDLDTWGDVVDIGLRSSRIRTRDNRMIVVPNSVIGKSLVVNHSYPNMHYRISTSVGIAYGTDIEHAREVLVKAVEGIPGVLDKQPINPTQAPIEALVVEFGDSSVNFMVRWWIDSYVDTRRIIDKVNSAIYKALATEGIEIPFPQRDVWHKISPADVEQLKDILRRE